MKQLLEGGVSLGLTDPEGYIFAAQAENNRSELGGCRKLLKPQSSPSKYFH